MNKIIFADALNGLRTLADESIHTCITSPPYYGLRDYGVEGQIGLENSPEEYIEHLICVFQEVKRVLRSDGTLWVNIADSYAGSGKGAWKNKKAQKEIYVIEPDSPLAHMPKIFSGIKRKDLMGIPWMLAFALREQGWYLRQDIIWYKPNCMPESVKDRCTKSYEHIFLLSKSDKYYFDYQAIKEPAVGFDKSSPRGSRGAVTPNSGRRKGNNKSFRGGGVYTNNRSYINTAEKSKATIGNTVNETGLRNKRDVWNISTCGYNGAHFATFPPKLIEPCVLAGSPLGGVVLDPFLGSGTTMAVSNRLGRECIGIEINRDYKPLIYARMYQ